MGVRLLGVTVRSLRRGLASGGCPGSGAPADVELGPDSPDAKGAVGSPGLDLAGSCFLDNDPISGDAATIWMLGRTLHEMLFGRRPSDSGSSDALHLPDQPKVTSECRE